ncbi:uncharacterized protein LOC124807509 [Hydra vulgaris]|uniref:uncharacterized protein LOC124807509 n=1 Tax=Hydra vulgaris TaxID=6087 RepID=UPI001F5E55A3|nr:uncharacterized protein LOC124807509 [Hydra vulgaris]
MSLWSVVFFPDTAEVEVVPTNWINSEKGIVYCKWPSTLTCRNPRDAVKKRINPEQSGLSYNVMIKYHTDDYLLACEKSKKGELVSDLTSSGLSESENLTTKNSYLFAIVNTCIGFMLKYVYLVL